MSLINIHFENLNCVNFEICRGQISTHVLYHNIKSQCNELTKLWFLCFNVALRSRQQRNCDTYGNYPWIPKWQPHEIGRIYKQTCNREERSTKANEQTSNRQTRDKYQMWYSKRQTKADLARQLVLLSKRCRWKDGRTFYFIWKDEEPFDMLKSKMEKLLEPNIRNQFVCCVDRIHLLPSWSFPVKLEYVDNITHTYVMTFVLRLECILKHFSGILTTAILPYNWVTQEKPWPGSKQFDKI